jgi:hypothetical protein
MMAFLVGKEAAMLNFIGVRLSADQQYIFIHLLLCNRLKNRLWNNFYNENESTSKSFT